MLALLLIAGAAYYYFYYYQKQPAPIFPSAQNGINPFADIVAGKSSTLADCGNEINQTTKDICWQSKAVTEKNANFCKSIKESTIFVSQDACINLVAHEKKDKSLCASITNQALNKNCKETIK